MSREDWSHFEAVLRNMLEDNDELLEVVREVLRDEEVRRETMPTSLDDPDPEWYKNL